ncbi:MAG: tetratricopeptide repeat protein [Planctomycetota bacterium]|nr:tetratricopeptide repeat protein [Planctomycetota bacterium]
MRRLSTLWIVLGLFSIHLTILDADEAKVWNQRGIELLEEGDLGNALSAFQRAQQADPDDQTIRRNLSYAHAKQGIENILAHQLEKGIAHLQKALLYCPTESRYNYWLGVGYYRKNDYFAAIVELKHVLEKNPEHAESHEYLGYSYYHQGRIPLALKHWKQSIRLRPKNDNLKRWILKAEREQVVESKYESSRSAHFTIRYDSKRADLIARKVLNLLEDAHFEIGSVFRYYPKEPVEVVLYSEKDFRSVTRSHHWVGGLYDGKIRVAVRGWQTVESELRGVIRHEYTHVLISKLAPNAPAWLNEGLAQMLEGDEEAKIAHSIVVRASRENKLLPWSTLRVPFHQIKDTRQVEIAYAQSESFVRWIASRYGRPSFAGILRELTNGVPLPEAFQKEYHQKLEDLLALWKASLT